jgi:hypothetical protein
MKLQTYSRRRLLRGLAAGGAIGVGLPFLDCFLNENGNALASTGSRLPVRFGTWYYGLGLPPGYWEPKQTTDESYEFPPLLSMLTPHKQKLTVFSGMRVDADGKSTEPHDSGANCIFTGVMSQHTAAPGKSLDQSIAEVIGGGTRFRSIQAVCNGNPKVSLSSSDVNAVNPSEVSPLALYTRIFGPGFTEPGADTFSPDPEIMVRESALSAVGEQRRDLLRLVGAEDRRRLDQYFTSLRDLENKLLIELSEPAPMPACSKPERPGETAEKSVILDDVRQRHDLFAELLAHALACGQTRVFNLALSHGNANIMKKGNPTHHHALSHEEPVDEKIGYQPLTTWFSLEYMKLLDKMLATLDNYQEGDGSLLDNVLMYIPTDHGNARLHSLQDIPIFLAGGAGGRVKTGQFLPLRGQPITRVGLTVQQLMGVPIGSWGTGANEVSAPIDEIVA